MSRRVETCTCHDVVDTLGNWSNITTCYWVMFENLPTLAVFRSKHKPGLLWVQIQWKPPSPGFLFISPQQPELRSVSQRLRLMWPPALPWSWYLHHRRESGGLSVLSWLQRRVLWAYWFWTKPGSCGPRCPVLRYFTDGCSFYFHQKVQKNSAEWFSNLLETKTCLWFEQESLGVHQEQIVGERNSDGQHGSAAWTLWFRCWGETSDLF